MSAPAPTMAQARARLAAVDPAAYARTRNRLDGAAKLQVVQQEMQFFLRIKRGNIEW